MLLILLPLIFTLFTPSFSAPEGPTIPAVRVVRLQVNYEKAVVSDIQRINKWNSILRNSVLASLKFINKHWLICSSEEHTSNDCGKAQITGEIVNDHHYRINVTFIGERDPIRNAKVDATSTVNAVSQIGLKGGIFQYTNALKVLGKPSATLAFDEAFFCHKGATLVETDKCRLCPPGHFHTESNCAACPKGAFQPSAGRGTCFTCIEGTTTSEPGAVSEEECFPICPAGYFFDLAAGICEPCSLRGFTEEPGADRCSTCPPGTVPLYLNSTSVDHCLENCPAGSQRSPDGRRCIPCTLGSFKTADDAVCMQCPTGYTTLSTGSKKLEACDIKICYPGTFLNSSSIQCESCDYGLYQDEYDGRICKICPVSTTTYAVGANTVTLCLSTNQCKSGQHKCHWLAACMDLPDDNYKPRYACKCKPGYVGNGYNCADACDGFCSNGSTCLKTGRGEVKCTCRKGFTGKRCDINN